MAEIYAEMLMADQWIHDNSSMRTKADTSLVYEPIFERYGYNTEDYQASVAHYMNDPERYSRILRTTTEILEASLEELKELKKIEDRRKAIVPYKIDPYRLYYIRSVERLWEFGDSVSVEMDTLAPVLEMHLHETSDTLYDGLNIVLRTDTTAVVDTIPTKVSADETELNLKPVVFPKDTLKRTRDGYLKLATGKSIDKLKK